MKFSLYLSVCFYYSLINYSLFSMKLIKFQNYLVSLPGYIISVNVTDRDRMFTNCHTAIVILPLLNNGSLVVVSTNQHNMSVYIFLRSQLLEHVNYHVQNRQLPEYIRWQQQDNTQASVDRTKWRMACFVNKLGLHILRIKELPFVCKFS